MTWTSSLAVSFAAGGSGSAFLAAIVWGAAASAREQRQRLDGHGRQLVWRTDSHDVESVDLPIEAVRCLACLHGESFGSARERRDVERGVRFERAAHE